MRVEDITIKIIQMIKLIEKVGFFRLTLIPFGLIIMISAFNNGILGMGIIGAVVFLFGLLNKCLLLGKCDIESESRKNKPIKKNTNYKMQPNDSRKGW